jgi:DNA polymerase type B, organellar and viral
MKKYDVRPKRFVVFDTETYANKLRLEVPTTELTLRLGCVLVVEPETAHDCHQVPYRFRTAREFHEVIHGLRFSKEPIYIFAHNAGFDLRIIEWWRYLTLGWYTITPPEGAANRGRYKTPLVIIDSPPTIVRAWRDDGQQIVILDTYQWVSKSLLDIGDMCGYPKAEMPSDDATEDEWFAYCERDVNVTRIALEGIWGFLNTLKLPGFSVTPAVQAKQLYRMRFEHKRIKHPSTLDEMEFERNAYYGGMVECFYHGMTERVTHHLDVNSLYPHVMAERPMPCEVLASDLGPGREKPADDWEPWCHTAEVWIDSPEWPWPVRGRDETLYVRGRVHTVLSGPELERAYSMGVIRWVGRWIKYKLDDLFSGYVNYLWACKSSARKRGDKLTEYIAKSMLNSLHGKFGQRTGDWVAVGQTARKGFYGHGKCIGEGVEEDEHVRYLDGMEMKRIGGCEDPRGFVPIASWTASAGRVYMHDLRSVAGHREVLYQATDSLLLTGEGMAQLQLAEMCDDVEIGMLRYEGSYPWANVHGVHALDLGESRRRPGIRRNASRIYGEVYEQEEWEGFSVAACRGNVSSVFIRLVCKHLRLAYDRRETRSDGWTVPWAIDNWDMSIEDQRKSPIR